MSDQRSDIDPFFLDQRFSARLYTVGRPSLSNPPDAPAEATNTGSLKSMLLSTLNLP